MLLLIPVLWMASSTGQHPFPLVWFGRVCLIGPLFIVPPLFNLLPSRFQAKRSIIASYICGVLVGPFIASPPFGRLLLYEDGVELRVMFQRYFIPYAQMVSAFQLTLHSDLPRVPRTIRIVSLRSGPLVKQVNAMRAAAHRR